jgi:hypothetical protein
LEEVTERITGNGMETVNSIEADVPIRMLSGERVISHSS